MSDQSSIDQDSFVCFSKYSRYIPSNNNDNLFEEETLQNRKLGESQSTEIDKIDHLRIMWSPLVTNFVLRKQFTPEVTAILHFDIERSLSEIGI